MVVSMVAVGYRSPNQADVVANLASNPGISAESAPSVDQLLTTTIAANLAEKANLPVAANVANLSVSLAARSELAQTDETIMNKPQIIQPAANNRDITTYTTKQNDTVGSVATAYGISNDTLKWANNLSSDALEPGRELIILPVDGVRYTIKSGDTIDSLAEKYKASQDRIIAFNDLELVGAPVNKTIIIPGGVLPETERPGYVSPRSNYRAPASGGSRESGQIVPSAFSNASAGNRYAFGNCTWYAYERRAQLGRPIGSFWGNANTWDSSGMSAGFTVNKTPAPGAIIQWNEYSEPYIGYAGHVGIVESVNPDGSITITEMNNGAYGGFNRVNSRTFVPSAAISFIH
jgi:surface antigen/LysM repeat protein